MLNGMQILMASLVEVIAAVADPPRLLPGGAQASVVVSGQTDHLSASGQRLTQRFYLPCLALGPLAARLGTLGVGEAVMLRGPLVYQSRDFRVLANEVLRLPHDPSRLLVSAQGVPTLLRARQQASVRGVLVQAPALSMLRDRQPVANVRLGLRPRGSGREAGLVMLELAAYGPLAEGLMSVSRAAIWRCGVRCSAAGGSGPVRSSPALN